MTIENNDVQDYGPYGLDRIHPGKGIGLVMIYKASVCGVLCTYHLKRGLACTVDFTARKQTPIKISTTTRSSPFLSYDK